MSRIKAILWTLATLLGAAWISLWFTGGNRRRLAVAMWNLANRALRRLYIVATIFVLIVLGAVTAELVLGGLGLNWAIPWVLLGTFLILLAIGMIIVMIAPALSTLVGGVAVAQNTMLKAVGWGLGLHVAVGLLMWFTPTESHWTLLVVILVSVIGILLLSGAKGFLGGMQKVCIVTLVAVLAFLNLWERDWGAIQAPKSVRLEREHDLGLHKMTWTATPGTYTGTAGHSSKDILLEHVIVLDDGDLTATTAKEDGYQSFFRGKWDTAEKRFVGTWVTKGPRISSGTFVLDAGGINAGKVVMDGQLLDASGNTAASVRIRPI